HGVESMRGTPLPFQIFDDWGPHRRRICPLISNSLTIGYLSVLEYHTAFDAVPGEIYDLVAGVLVKELTIEQAIRLSHQHDSAEMLLSSILNEGFANRALFLQRILGTVFEQAGPYSLIGINMHAFSSRVSGERHFKARLGTIFPKA
ncbi:ribose 5-phosphate isomerase B, partial [Dysosmobacter welbionis]